MSNDLSRRLKDSVARIHRQFLVLDKRLIETTIAEDFERHRSNRRQIGFICAKVE
jgi:hypothetical protein